MRNATANLHPYRDDTLYEKLIVIIIQSSLYYFEERNVAMRRASNLSVDMFEQIQQHEPARKDTSGGSYEKYEN